jgi:hypothetical protein
MRAWLKERTTRSLKQHRIVCLMSVPGFWNRVRNWIPFASQRLRLQQVKENVEGKPRKRKPFQTKVLLPWYSLERPRNMIIGAGMVVLFLYWDTIVIVRKGFVASYRVHKEREKFLKQLDEEDRIFEEQLASGNVSEYLLK